MFHAGIVVTASSDGVILICKVNSDTGDGPAPVGPVSASTSPTPRLCLVQDQTILVKKLVFHDLQAFLVVWLQEDLHMFLLKSWQRKANSCQPERAKLTT